jgi:hypothetical protein
MFVLWSEEYDLNAHPGYYWQIYASWVLLTNQCASWVLLTNLRILGIRDKSILLGRRTFQTPPLRTWPRHRRLSQGSVCWARPECCVILCVLGCYRSFPWVWNFVNLLCSGQLTLMFSEVVCLCLWNVKNGDVYTTPSCSGSKTYYIIFHCKCSYWVGFLLFEVD